jgi:hypothetical protein
MSAADPLPLTFDAALGAGLLLSSAPVQRCGRWSRHIASVLCEDASYQDV